MRGRDGMFAEREDGGNALSGLGDRGVRRMGRAPW